MYIYIYVYIYIYIYIYVYIYILNTIAIWSHHFSCLPSTPLSLIGIKNRYGSRVCLKAKCLDITPVAHSSHLKHQMCMEIPGAFRNSVSLRHLWPFFGLWAGKPSTKPWALFISHIWDSFAPRNQTFSFSGVWCGALICDLEYHLAFGKPTLLAPVSEGQGRWCGSCCDACAAYNFNSVPQGRFVYWTHAMVEAVDLGGASQMLLVFTMILGRLRGSFGGMFIGGEPTSRQLNMDPQMEQQVSIES